jgi:cytochrome c oxidase cbb3-type subunit I/II
MTFGMLYWLMPRIYQTKMWSPKLVSLHFWVGTIGILLYIIPIYAAGLMQGLMWRAIDETGHLMYPDFVETTQSIVPLWWLRVLGGVVCQWRCDAVLQRLMTWTTRPAKYEVQVQSAARLSRFTTYHTPAQVNELATAPVLELVRRSTCGPRWAGTDVGNACR